MALALTPPPKWLHNMCTEIATFDVDNATKNYENIIDWGPYKGPGVGYDWDVAYIQWKFLTENFEN